jgi:hypothetical protein
VVRVLVEMIAPYKGRVYDPCCGSGGMFVQSEKFIEAHAGKIGDISIYGQESNYTTWRLAKMNLAIRGIGQAAMRRVFDEQLARVEWDERKFAVRLFPVRATDVIGAVRPIAIDAHVAFGRPVLAQKGITTGAIVERMEAGDLRARRVNSGPVFLPMPLHLARSKAGAPCGAPRPAAEDTGGVSGFYRLVRASWSRMAFSCTTVVSGAAAAHSSAARSIASGTSATLVRIPTPMKKRPVPHEHFLTPSMGASKGAPWGTHGGTVTRLPLDGDGRKWGKMPKN